MKDEVFRIRAYGKSELALLYLPHHSKKTALNIMREWISINPRISYLLKVKGHYYTPKQVSDIVRELGEP